MPYSVRNTFHAQTPLGSGIQALTRGLFGGATPEEQEAKLAAAEYSRAHADQARALTDATRQKMARERDAAAAMANAPAEVVAGLFGGKPQGDAIMAFRSGAQVDAPFGTGMTGGLDEQDVPAAKMAAPRPDFYTPEREATLNRTLAGIAAARALPGNDTAAHLATIIKGLFDDQTRQGALSGSVTPEQIGRVGAASAAVAGKPIFHQGSDGTSMDNFTGRVDATSPLAKAVIGLRGAQAGKERDHGTAFRAQAGASSARARLSDARTEDVKESRKMIQLITPEGYPAVDNDGNPIMVRNDKAGEIYARGLQDRRRDADKPERPGAAGKAAPLRKLTKNDTDLMRKELDNLLVDLDAADIDGQTRNAILAAAENGWVGSTKGHAGVIKDALDSVAPQGFQKKPGIPGFRKQAPAGGLPAAPPAGQAGPMLTPPQGIPPVEQRERGKVYQTPRGPMSWTGTGWVPAGGA